MTTDGRGNTSRFMLVLKIFRRQIQLFQRILRCRIISELLTKLLTIGKPMYLMETALGQFSQSSPLTVWRLAPIGRGIGFAMVTISLIVAIYYNILMGN